MNTPVHRRVATLATAALTAFALLAGLTGCAARPAEARPTDTAAPGTLIERIGQQFTGADVTDDVRAKTLTIVPKQRTGGLAVFLHGWSQTRWSMLTRAEESSVVRELVDAGYVVASADAAGKAWGDQTSVEDYERLIETTRTKYELRDVFLMGESMGGLATMQVAAAVPEVRAVVAWYPVCDLATMRQPRFQPSIEAAWPRGFARLSPVRVSDKPLMVWASPADTVVDARTNAERCVANARAAGATVTYFRTTGEHGDPSNFVPQQVRAFFDGHRTPGP